jgi:hypothetical protein
VTGKPERIELFSFANKPGTDSSVNTLPLIGVLSVNWLEGFFPHRFWRWECYVDLAQNSDSRFFRTAVIVRRTSNAELDIVIGWKWQIDSAVA